MTMTSTDQLRYSYGAFVLCVVGCIIPVTMVQVIFTVLTLVVLIAFYMIRSKKNKESFEYKEMSSLIKTFWIWSALYVGGLMVAGIIVSTFGDMTALNELTASIFNGAAPDEAAIQEATLRYTTTNFNLITGATILCILPALIYSGLRVKQGLARLKNPPVPEIEPIID